MELRGSNHLRVIAVSLTLEAPSGQEEAQADSIKTETGSEIENRSCQVEIRKTLINAARC